MKNLVLFCLILVLFGCRGPNDKISYFNEKLVVRNKIESMDKTGKHSVGSVKYFLLYRVKDTTMFTEMNRECFANIDHPRNEFKNYDDHYYDSLWYNTGENDTLYFKYIAKRRFFKIL